MKDLTKTSSYWYDLPPELVAQYPLPNRASSRLLHLDRLTGKVSHHHFSEIIDYLRPDDVLVVNKTKVIPARLFGHKSTGAKAEVFLLNQQTEDTWECLVKPGRKLQTGTEIFFADDFSGLITGYAEEGGRLVRFRWLGDFWQNLDSLGKTPLPPYIKRESLEQDKETYQTVYAQERGSVAAPTAGLHFTPELLERIADKGVEICELNLRVGLGTFRPVKTENITEHIMHSEFCQISDEVAAVINQAKAAGRRIIAVGTTTTRTLESFAENGQVRSGSHSTDIFIYPGKKIRIIDGLITNFHMPESTLMMLVSAFAGYENIMNAYKIAVQEKYRFFSYGDAMVII
ncbi:MAG TPA: tRNA preQ1(34) S-adenosylmethionine ribosyltransferase-isomerase QueA [Candidatus Cloacimonadota bacterium]|nr:tRNA preQ1(34) S-adenosylmethionine ribosyltransferase-isomerase QueA [Candidatus Cloacimonadota bacterium]